MRISVGGKVWNVTHVQNGNPVPTAGGEIRYSFGHVYSDPDFTGTTLDSSTGIKPIWTLYTKAKITRMDTGMLYVLNAYFPVNDPGWIIVPGRGVSRYNIATT